MDAFLISLSNLCTEVMPILGAGALIALIVFLIKLTKVLESVNSTLGKTHNTIDLVDKSIEKVQAPLDTAVKLSGTVDKAHDATVDVLNKTKDYVKTNAPEIKEFVVKNAEEIKEKVVTFVGSKSEMKEPSPEDIIGG